MKSNLKKEALEVSKRDGAIVGFNVYGFEEAKAIISAAERCNYPTALMLNKLTIKHLPVESWAGMLLPLIERAKVPISLHLDHCQDFETIVRAITSGFTSVMIDGSQYPIEENIRMSKEIVKIAKCYGVTVEGEIGSVPYADIPGAAKDILTSVEDAKRYVTESGVDWVAVAVGQIHRLQEPIMRIQFEQLRAIEAVTQIPLVIHGVSGIYKDDLWPMVQSRVAKLNVGTELRMTLVQTLQKSIVKNPKEYDRLILFEEAQCAVTEKVQSIIEKLRVQGENIWKPKD